MTDPQPPVTTAFTSAFREALRSSGLSLGQLSARMERLGHPVTKAALSSWQNGRSQPRRASTLAGLPDLEWVLGVEPGSLSDILGRTGAPPLARGRHAVLSTTADSLDAVRREWDIPWTEMLEHEFVHSRCRILPDRSRVVRHRILLRSKHDGADRFLSSIHALYGTELPTHRAVAACSIGRETTLEGGTAMAIEVLLPGPLPAGERLAVEFERRWPPIDAQRYELRSAHPTEMILTQVVFPTEALPTQVRRVAGRILPDGGIHEEVEPWEGLRGRSESSAVEGRDGVLVAVEWR